MRQQTTTTKEGGSLEKTQTSEMGQKIREVFGRKYWKKVKVLSRKNMRERTRQEKN